MRLAMRLRSFAIWALFVSAVVGLSPGIGRASGTLFGVTQCCPNNLVKIDPATGQQTVVANLSPSSGFAGFQSAIGVDAASHTVFVLRLSFPPPPSVPVNELLSVNDQTGVVSSVPLTTGLFALAFDSSSHALFGVTQCCPNNLVQVDPGSGQQTVIANLSPSSGFAGFQSATALNPANHTVFVLRLSFPPPPSPPVNELLSVNDQTGALSSTPLSTGLFALSFDGGSGALFGVTQCCPNNLVQVDPGTGQETAVANLSPSTGFVGFQSSTALDPASHTAFVLRLSFPPPPSAPVNELLSVNDQTGTLSSVALSTGVFLLAFEAPTVTPESLKADVLQAGANGTIRNSGLTTSLVAILDAAASARAAGDCTTAANIYGAFINELQAQSDKGIASDTAGTLVSEAQFLATHCP